MTAHAKPITDSQQSAIPTEFDAEQAGQFVGKVISDCAATVSLTLAVLGDQLGLYQALAGAGPLTSSELAARAHVSERYVREWLINQAAAGYLAYDPPSGRYHLPAAQAVALLDQDSPFYVGGALLIALAMTKAAPRIRETFRTGAGMGWGEHDASMFVGCERLFRPGYLAHLVQQWIPALDDGGVHRQLEQGATVADIGCGHGASTLILAQAYPNSRFFGYDAHPASIAAAQAQAEAAGVADRVTFAVASSVDYPPAPDGAGSSGGYDLVAFFDCLHDIGDPATTIAHTRARLAPEGTLLLVEPAAGERVEENFNPVGQFYSGASVLVCTPNALATSAGAGAGAEGEALGTVATEAALAAVVYAGGLSRFRRVLTTPLNRIFEARI